MSSYQSPALGLFFAAKLLTPNMPLCKGQILITLCLTFINQTFLSVCLCAGKLDQSTIGHNKATISSTKAIWNYILCICFKKSSYCFAFFYWNHCSIQVDYGISPTSLSFDWLVFTWMDQQWACPTVMQNTLLLLTQINDVINFFINDEQIFMWPVKQNHRYVAGKTK